MSQLFPGMLVRVDVRSQRLNGFKCKLLNTFNVGLHVFDVENLENISVHEKINVRIMYSDLNSKVILVSALPCIVAMEDKEDEEKLKIGSTLEDCVVQHSINGKGLILSNESSERLFCPMSRITDKSTKQILKSKKYTVRGVRARSARNLIISLKLLLYHSLVSLHT